MRLVLSTLICGLLMEEHKRERERTQTGKLKSRYVHLDLTASPCCTANTNKHERKRATEKSAAELLHIYVELRRRYGVDL